MSDTQKETTVSEEPYLAETLTGDREPYTWDRATIFVGMVIYPEDGAPEGRRVAVTAWSHRDAPVAVTCRKSELGAFPKPMADALKQLRADFPAREAASRERDRLAAERRAAVAKPVDKPAPKAKAATKAAPKAATSETVDVVPEAGPVESGPLFAGIGARKEEPK
jgi:hypothetical protein